MWLKLLLFLWGYTLYVQCNENEVNPERRSTKTRSLRSEMAQVLNHLDILGGEEWVETARRRLDYIPNSHRVIPYNDVNVANSNFTFASQKEEEACKGTQIHAR